MGPTSDSSHLPVSGFTIVRNGTKFDYPYLESLRSLLPLVDELVINVGVGEDDTLDRVRRFAAEEGAGKVVIFESEWPMNDPEKRRGGLILSEQTNLALERCTHDWCFYLQADEVLHEADTAAIRSTLTSWGRDPRVEALLFDYVHLYGSYDVEQYSRSAYRREVRAVRKSAGARSVGDAQSFRKPDGSKLAAIRCGARVFHYGWVRTPDAMKAKTVFMDQLYHGEAKPSAEGGESVPHTGDNYRYKRIIGLRRLRDAHPAIMRERIRQKNWNWDFENSPLEWTWKDAKKVVLDNVEKATGFRAFEYRSYRLIRPAGPVLPAHGAAGNPARSAANGSNGNGAASGHPAASIILATYNEPRALEMVLAGLERQSTTDFEIVICDDGSGPETKRVIDEFKARGAVPVLHLWQEDQGFRKCRILNEGLRRSRGEVLIFLDGDCVPHRCFVQDHLDYQEPGRYLAGRRMELGPKITKWLTPEKVRNGFFDVPRPRLIASAMSGDSEHLQRSFRVTSPCLRAKMGMDRVADLKGCNFSVPRSAMEAINGFDEFYEGYGREDTDVELRLQNLGLTIKSVKGVAIQYHLWHPRREFTPANDDRLDELKRSGRTRCEQGMHAAAPAR